jgi:probable rRNA maturation factor
MSGAEDPVAVDIEADAWTVDLPGAAEMAREAAMAALDPGATRAVAILLTDDATVAELNLRFRGKTGATNVLSFPAPAFAGDALGDIALAHGVCAAEAAAQGKALADHLRHLVVHGVLHLLGHDHQAEGEAEEMERLERRLLAKLGIGDPYDAGPVAEEPARAAATHDR